MLRHILIAVLSVTALAGPALGQTAPDPYAPRDPVELEAYLRARGEAYHRAPDAQQDPEELRRTMALNAEIAARNAAAEAEERSSAEAYAKAESLYREQMSAAEAARLNHEADVRAAEAAQAQYERDYAAWQARARACQAGDRMACGPW
jgi:hypothetical protein